MGNSVKPSEVVLTEPRVWKEVRKGRWETAVKGPDGREYIVSTKNSKESLREESVKQLLNKNEKEFLSEIGKESGKTKVLVERKWHFFKTRTKVNLIVREKGGSSVESGEWVEVEKGKKWRILVKDMDGNDYTVTTANRDRQLREKALKTLLTQKKLIAGKEKKRIAKVSVKKRWLFFRIKKEVELTVKKEEPLGKIRGPGFKNCFWVPRRDCKEYFLSAHVQDGNVYTVSMSSDFELAVRDAIHQYLVQQEKKWLVQWAKCLETKEKREPPPMLEKGEKTIVVSLQKPGRRKEGIQVTFYVNAREAVKETSEPPPPLPIFQLPPLSSEDKKAPPKPLI